MNFFSTERDGNGEMHIATRALRRLTDHELMLKEYIKVKITETGGR